MSYGFHVSINFTITALTIDDLLPTYYLAINDLGVDSLLGIKFFPSGNGLVNVEECALNNKSWSNFFAHLTKLKLNGEIEHMQLSVTSPWEFYLPLIEHDIDIVSAEKTWNYLNLVRQIGPKYYSIADSMGIADLCISSTGEVYPTVLLDGVNQLVCGDLKRSTLQNILVNSDVLKMVRSLTIDDIGEPCSNCYLSTLCGGGSRARGYLDSGKLNGLDIACPLIGASRHIKHDKGSISCAEVAMIPKSNGKEDKKDDRENVSRVLRSVFIGDNKFGLKILFLSNGDCEIRGRQYVIKCNKNLSKQIEILDQFSRLERMLPESNNNGDYKKLLSAKLTEMLCHKVDICAWEIWWQYQFHNNINRWFTCDVIEQLKYYVKKYKLCSLKTLEIGCGFGHNARYLAESCECDVTAIDLLPDVISSAATLHKEVVDDCKLTFKHENIFDSSDNVDKYDYIVDILTSQSLMYNYEAFVDYVKQRLARGGYVLLVGFLLDDRQESFYPYLSQDVISKYLYDSFELIESSEFYFNNTYYKYDTMCATSFLLRYMK